MAFQSTHPPTRGGADDLKPSFVRERRFWIVSIHAPHAGGRRTIGPAHCRDPGSSCFNPRPHAGGDAGSPQGHFHRSRSHVSIHAPPRGGRPRGCCMAESLVTTSRSQSTPPTRGRRQFSYATRMLPVHYLFQSTPPTRRGRLQYCLASGTIPYRRDSVSIHAPHAGGDSWAYRRFNLFTPPTREGNIKRSARRNYVFNPPHAVTIAVIITIQLAYVSIRPHAKRPLRLEIELYSGGFSHAPTRGRDPSYASTPPRPTLADRFNPRPHTGGGCVTGEIDAQISIPVGFNPRPHTGATQSSGIRQKRST